MIPAAGDPHLSTIMPTVDGQRPQTLPGEEQLVVTEQQREPYSPHSAPPSYPLYSQKVVSPTQNAQFRTVPPPPSPSYKALGKRRASSIETPVDYHHDTPDTTLIHERPDSPAPPYTAARSSRHPQKGKQSKTVVRPPKAAPAPRTRIMPSRQRRGTTYGIGSNPIDAMIIEAQQRAAEYIPVVDPEAIFTITTDPKGPPVAGPSTSGAQETGKEDERYFEREEVAENMRQQATIQTPEFCLLSEVYQPSSRLRTRTEADVFDSSDAAYERRHRKHEMFEKRQRRREKDKLEHERYKLKERVEQLRAMDVQHFRALLPASGGDSTQELESVRNELLAHADDLIRRYDVLLPPDPRAANGQRLRLKEWEIRREGNRFIPLTDEAASELAAAGLLDEQSAAEAAAAGLLITAAGPGLPLGGKGGKGYGTGFRPDLSSSDEGEDDGEGEPEEDADVAQHEEEAETTRHSSPEAEQTEEVQEEHGVDDHAQLPAPVEEPPRPSSGMLRIKLKVPRPSTTPKSSELSQDVTRSPSVSGDVPPQEEHVASIDDTPTEMAHPPETSSNAAPHSTSSQVAPPDPCTEPLLADGYPTPAPSTVSLGGALTAANTGVWTELPYHDVPYEHQPREVPSAAPVPPTVAPRLRTPVASTPAPTGVPVLLAAAEREANQAAGRRGRNLRTAEAFGVKLPRVLEEEKDFKLPEEWVVQHVMAIDVNRQSVP